MSIFEGFLSTSETLSAFSDRNFVDAMLRFAAGLTLVFGVLADVRQAIRSGDDLA